MSTEYEYVQRLLRLKRYEQPQEGYYEQFLDEFRNRREAEEAGITARGPNVLDRATDWFHELGSRRWVYATGAAYAALMIGVFFSEALETDQSDILADRKATSAAVIPVELSGDETSSKVLGSKKNATNTSGGSANSASSKQ